MDLAFKDASSDLEQYVIGLVCVNAGERGEGSGARI